MVKNDLRDRYNRKTVIRTVLMFGKLQSGKYKIQRNQWEERASGMKIIKRSGSESQFDLDKIISAVIRANDSVAETERMSKEQIEQGFLSEAVVNFVALLGWSPVDNREIFSLEELVKEFDYHHISKSPAVFDMVKLKWMNGEYIKAMDFDAFYEMAEPYIKEVVHRDCDYKKIAQMVKTRIEIFPDIKEHIDFIEAVPEYDVAMYTHKKMKTNAETSLAVLKDVLPLLEAQEDYSNDALYAMLSAYVKENGYKNGYVMWPIRTALSGKQMTPGGATELMEVLGKEESIARIKAAIEKLTAEA